MAKWLKIGDEIGRLKILDIMPAQFFASAKVKCKCGTVKIVKLVNVIAGRTKSCGCLRREQIERYQARRRERLGNRRPKGGVKRQVENNKRNPSCLGNLPPSARQLSKAKRQVLN